MRRFIYILFIISLLCNPSRKAYCQLQTFGEFSVCAGPYKDLYDEYTCVLASGSFGIQYSILSAYVGAGPSLYWPKDDRKRRDLFDHVGVHFPVGVMLRIPVHNMMLQLGNEFFFAGPLKPQVGLLFRRKWNYCGAYVSALLNDPHISYVALGLKFTLNHESPPVIPSL